MAYVSMVNIQYSVHFLSDIKADIHVSIRCVYYVPPDLPGEGDYGMHWMRACGSASSGVSLRFF